MLYVYIVAFNIYSPGERKLTILNEVNIDHLWKKVKKNNKKKIYRDNSKMILCI